jgi:hypothetical protein
MLIKVMTYPLIPPCNKYHKYWLVFMMVLVQSLF